VLHNYNEGCLLSWDVNALKMDRTLSSAEYNN